MWDAVIILALIVLCTLGVLLVMVRLPGTWLIVVSAVGYAWWSDWSGTSLVVVGVLTGIAIVGEVAEFATTLIAARKAGASKQAAWGGLVGGILGMLFLSFLFPVPLVGTMIGAVLGCFLGAAVVELAVRKRLAQGTKVGLFSALGFVLGTVVKTSLVLMMSGLLLTTAVCSRVVNGG